MYPNQDIRLIYNIIPAEQVGAINRDPVTNNPVEYILKSEHEWVDGNGDKKTSTITQKIGIGTRTILVEGDVPSDIEGGIYETPWDFIPIVHFKNELF